MSSEQAGVDGTPGPHSATAAALKLYDDCLHLKLALW